MGKRKNVLIIICLFTLLGLAFIFVVNPKYNFKNLSVDEATWNEIISARTINDNVSIKKIAFNDYSLIIDEKNSTIYYSIINKSANSLAPAISYSISNQGYKLCFLRDKITEDKILNNYDFKLIIYNKTNYRPYTLKCTIMPTLNIVYNEDQNPKKEIIPVTVHLFDNLGDSSKRVVISDGKMSNFDENRYSLKLNKQSPGKNTRKNDISLFNMLKNNEYILEAVDKETIQEGSLSFKFIKDSNKLMPPIVSGDFDEMIPPFSGDLVKSPRHPSGDLGKMPPPNIRLKQAVELFINNEYIGLYNLRPIGKNK